MGPEQGPIVLGMASSLTNPSKVHVISPEKMHYSGQLPAGFSAQMLPLPNVNSIAIASTYYSRIYRGERTDVLELWDRATLTFKKELIIPSTRALTAASRAVMAETLDNRFILIQNATPASSITVVDLINWKVLGEIPDPGCFGIYLLNGKPSEFASLCGDGKMAIYSLNTKGEGKFIGTSDPIFDPENDPVYIFAEYIGKHIIFLSFKGNIHVVDVENHIPKLLSKFSIVESTSENWCPGGYQPFALDPKSGVLFVLMHKNCKEGSHKTVAEEVWAIELATHHLLSRSPSEPIDALVNIPGTKPALVGGEPGNAYLDRYEVKPLEKFKVEPGYYQESGKWVPHLELMP